MSEIDVSKCEYSHDIFNMEGERKTMCIIHSCCCNSIDNSDCYYRQLQQLKQENEELKKRQNVFNIFKKIEKYKQCLDEIEEYIYADCEYNDSCDRNICMKCRYSSIHDKRILQLIKQAKEGEE